MTKYKIIIARYNEDVEWLHSEMNNCIIYNKGCKLNIENEVMLKNVGRESETYLQYIIANYDNLPDIVIFAQARISDHLGSNDVIHLLKLRDEAECNGKSHSIVHYDVGNCISFDKEWNLQNGHYYLSDNYKDNKQVTFLNWFTTNIQPDYPDPILLFCSGNFAVKKEYITNKPVEYYKKLIQEVNHHMNSTEGHFFERSWYYIFS